MKLSLTWLLEHIVDAPPLTADFAQRLVERIGIHVCEVSGFEPWSVDLSKFSLTPFAEAQNAPSRSFILMIDDRGVARTATYADIGGSKEGSLPPVWVPAEQVSGGWQAGIEATDFIVTIDNQVISHRPDLWSHRGFAREVAVLFGLRLRPEEDLVASLPIRHFGQRSVATDTLPFEIALEGTYCRRLAAAQVHSLTAQASVPRILFRLSRVEGRGISALVDLTNYVMFDLGQPMHVFDADKLNGQLLEARQAREGEQLTLLDGGTIALTPDDGIIADHSGPVALGGIMGGRATSVSASTTKILIEAANFAPDQIRKSSLRHKRRTESSMRFEKSLDPHNNTIALMRYLRLLQQLGITVGKPAAIASVGSLVSEHTIEMTHQYLVGRMGVSCSVERAAAFLTGLGCGVTLHEKQGVCTYRVVVPSYRSRDLVHKEDLVEEVVRLMGYANLVPQLPTKSMHPIDHTNVLRTRALKDLCAFGLRLHEVHNYALYDESFIKKIDYDPAESVTVANPVSANWRRMVTSLVPHLIKNVAHNLPGPEAFGFFEMNRCWPVRSGGHTEEQRLGICMFAATGLDFYTGKNSLQPLFDSLKMLVAWKKPLVGAVERWYAPGQVAELFCDELPLGFAGLVDAQLMREVGQGTLFVAELNLERLLHYVAPTPLFQPISNYQPVRFDLSMLVPRAGGEAPITVDRLQELLAKSDGRVVDVQLRDYFESSEWPDKRSITFRVTIVDHYKTLTKIEIDELVVRMTTILEGEGAQIR